jgi:predicted CXXCH cytochrome family protein
MKTKLVTITRNKKGQPIGTEQTVVADTLRIGRGAECKLHLADPRIALLHAEIFCGLDSVPYYIETRGGEITVDGTLERASTLKPGQRLLVGPFELIVLPNAKGVDLTLSVELIDPLKDDVTAVQSQVTAGMRSTWLSKRTFSWMGAAVVSLAFLAWPVVSALDRGHGKEQVEKIQTAKAVLTADASWDVGPLSSAHASFGSNCSSCHQQPFVQVTNSACEDCHKQIGWHFALDTKPAKALHAAVFGDNRCVECHRDHKGPMGLVRTDSPLCTDCHQNLKARHPQTGIVDVADFAKEHPPFKPSMLLPGKTGPASIVRVPQEDKVRFVEASGLKFPHEVHMSPKGIRGPEGRAQMECKNCHVADETGTRFKPVTMGEHCQTCHSLEFEPKSTARQVPHGKVADVIATVQEYYAQAALTDAPIDVVLEDGIKRPGVRVGETRRQAALEWANTKAEKVTQELFEVRVCFECHQIKRGESAADPAANPAARWEIAPIAITQHWLPKARFPHSRHDTYKCTSCHDVAGSKKSADISIPDIKNCRECHGGNVVGKDKAPGTCETCHGFHTGSPRSGVPPIIPGGNQPKLLPKSAAAKIYHAEQHALLAPNKAGGAPQ